MLKKLELLYFRNHKNRTIEFDKNTVIVGPNATGKTNILEAVQLLATGESFREGGKIEEMVNWESEVGHVMGKLKVQNSNVKAEEITHPNPPFRKGRENMEDDTELQVTVTRGLVQGRRVTKRRFLVNGVARRRQDLVGNLLTVCFRPEDLRIVEGSPSRRRQFFDRIWMQVDREYLRSLMAYNKGLVRRNKLLEMIREGRTTKTTLTYWDQLVIKNGEYVQKKRRELVDFINLSDSYQEFGLTLKYVPSVISEARLKQYEYEEVMAGHTLVGPHRDDYQIIAKSVGQSAKGIDRNLAMYGSRGEQRLGVLWLTMMAMDLIEAEKKVRPILLLDDIFSELDHEHRHLVFELMPMQQTIATTADEHYISGLDAKTVDLR
jgi:DNA replication and repair protein RecF